MMLGMVLLLREGEKVAVKGRWVTVTPTAFDCLPRVRARLVEAARAGETVTYGELREELGLPYLVQGMGGCSTSCPRTAPAGASRRWPAWS